MARNFTPVGNEFQVNQQIDNQEDDADIAAMTDGRFAVVHERVEPANSFDIRLEFVNADGTLAGTTVFVESDAGAQINPVVTARTGGGATVIWQDDADAGEIHFATVSSAGVVGSEQTVIAGAPLFEPDAAVLADGRVIVVAQQTGNIAANFIQASGTGTTGAHIMDSGTGFQDSAAVAASGNRALVVFKDGNIAPSGAIVARLYDGSGSAGSDYSARAILSGAGIPSSPDVAALSDGRYIVVWENDTNDDVEGRFVDANGNATGSVFTISNAAGDNEDPRVAALSDGGFVVTWENDGGLFPAEGNSDNDAIVARRFGKDGNPAGDLFLVNGGDPATSQDDPAIAVNRTTGNALIAWDDSHAYAPPEDNVPAGVRGRVHKVETDIITGTDDDDVIIDTYSLAETINGLNGRDRIDAGDGDDTLNGGRSNDDLRGQGGVDTFIFDNKNGRDRLDWEDGEALRFDSGVFKKPNKLGELKNKYFGKGPEARDDDDFFVYHKQKGNLFYDKNADGNGKSVLIAKLDKGSDLDASEIVLF